MVMAGKTGSAPNSDEFHSGCVLASIVHAIMMTRYPDLAHEHSWDGENYSIQDSMGSRGTVAFSGTRLVGAFFDSNSARNPFRSQSDYDVGRFFVVLPSNLRSIAYEEALQYVLEEYRGSRIPVITASFWSEGGRLVSGEPWNETFDNGARLVRIQMLPIDAGMAEWTAYYDMLPSQADLAVSLFQRKSGSRDVPLRLVEAERKVLIKQAKSQEGIEQCRASFAEIGIVF